MPIEFEVKVVKVGNSLRITLPKEICKAVEIQKGSIVGVSLNNGLIIIRKLR